MGPRVQQEVRENQDGWCRPRRRPQVLLRLTWDHDRRDWHNRNWKRHRKTQYRVIVEKEKKDSSKFSEHMRRKHHFWWDHKNCSWRNSRCRYCWENKVWGNQTKDEWKQEIKDRKEERLIEHEKRYKDLLNWQHNYRKMIG